MPPRLPDRYRLNIRLGSDDDVEEWLAKDDQLDRPVLVRYLAPESTEERRDEFLANVRAAATVADVHIQRVFAAAVTSASAFSVSEWDGGVTIADRIEASEPIAIGEFLPNAVGLAKALADFHASGGVHGAIDTSAVHYSAAHPLKLGAFGRAGRWSSPDDDTRALAEVIRAALTGSDDPTVFPSQVIDGAPPRIDEIIGAARRGEIGAATLSHDLGSLTIETKTDPPPARPWRMLTVFGLIVLAIALLGAVGLAADFDPDSPFLYPVAGQQPTPTITNPTIVAQPDDPVSLEATVEVYDPLGDGTESDESAVNVLDANRATSWSTEAYSRPIRDIKAGVGLVFRVAGTPGAIAVTGAPTTTYLIGWADRIPDDPAAWEHVGRGTLQQGEVWLQLPARGGGVWRLWITDLPQQPDGTYRSQINEVRFTD